MPHKEHHDYRTAVTLLVILLALLLHLLLLLWLFVRLTAPEIEQPDTQPQQHTDEPIYIDIKKQAALNPMASPDHPVTTPPTDEPISPPSPPTPAPEPQEHETPELIQETPTIQEAPEIQAPEQQVEPLPITQEMQIPTPLHPTPMPPQEKPKPVKKAVKKKPVLANFAQNFTQFIKETQGTDFFKRTGDESIRPDLQEMRMLSYMRKILWFLNNAHGAQRGTFNALYQQETMAKKLVLRFIIGQNGSLEDVRIIQSSGNNRIDTAYLDLIKYAAPFPPIPAHLNITTCPWHVSVDRATGVGGQAGHFTPAWD